MTIERTLSGRCSCGAIRYTLHQDPMIVHACHCLDCQRISGSAFALNMWIEQEYVHVDGDDIQSFRLTGGSGQPHDLYFCGRCGTNLWSKYHASPYSTIFVKAGTLDRPELVEPDVHIFTRTRRDWLVQGPDVPQYEAFYPIKEVWTPQSLERLRKSMATDR